MAVSISVTAVVPISGTVSNPFPNLYTLILLVPVWMLPPHGEGEFIFIFHELRLASWLTALNNQMQWKWYSVTSEPKSSQAWQLLLPFSWNRNHAGKNPNHMERPYEGESLGLGQRFQLSNQSTISTNCQPCKFQPSGASEWPPS